MRNRKILCQNLRYDNQLFYLFITIYIKITGFMASAPSFGKFREERSFQIEGGLFQ